VRAAPDTMTAVRVRGACSVRTPHTQASSISISSDAANMELLQSAVAAEVQKLASGTDKSRTAVERDMTDQMVGKRVHVCVGSALGCQARVHVCGHVLLAGGPSTAPLSLSLPRVHQHAQPRPSVRLPAAKDCGARQADDRGRQRRPAQPKGGAAAGV
jgi:hypothetical protein